MLRGWRWRLRGILRFSTATTWVVAVSVFIHILFRITARVEFIYGHSYALALTKCFALNWPLLIEGFVWQPLTYLFLHAGWWHLFLNMWACYIFGSVLERDYGKQLFLKVFFLGGLCGGAGWLVYTALLPHLSFMEILTNWIPPGLAALLHAGAGLEGTLENSVCIGASGGVLALLCAYIAIYPRRELYVLLFLVIPLRLKSQTLLWVILAFTLFDWFFVQSPIANASHFFGGALGYYLGWRKSRYCS